MAKPNKRSAPDEDVVTPKKPKLPRTGKRSNRIRNTQTVVEEPVEANDSTVPSVSTSDEVETAVVPGHGSTSTNAVSDKINEAIAKQVGNPVPDKSNDAVPKQVGNFVPDKAGDAVPTQVSNTISDEVDGNVPIDVAAAVVQPTRTDSGAANKEQPTNVETAPAGEHATIATHISTGANA